HSGRSEESLFRCEFSSSEYSKTIAAIVAGQPPSIDLGAEKRLIDCLVALAAEDTLESAHDASEGGLAVTIAESCFASRLPSGSSLSASVQIDDQAPAEFALFEERGARCVVSVAPGKLAAVLRTARQYQVAAHEIGKVIRGDAFRIELRGRVVIDRPV